jgi:hypothetical protein
MTKVDFRLIFHIKIIPEYVIFYMKMVKNREKPFFRNQNWPSIAFLYQKMPWLSNEMTPSQFYLDFIAKIKFLKIVWQIHKDENPL